MWLPVAARRLAEPHGMDPLVAAECAFLITMFVGLRIRRRNRLRAWLFWGGIFGTSGTLIAIGLLETHSTGPLILAIMLPGFLLLMNARGRLWVVEASQLKESDERDDPARSS